jgi:hypothetical protein
LYFFLEATDRTVEHCVEAKPDQAEDSRRKEEIAPKATSGGLKAVKGCIEGHQYVGGFYIW